LDAARLGNSNALNLFLDKGADGNRKAIHDYTALHGAADLGDTNMIQILLQKGADVNLQDDDGNTPLHYAAHAGQIDAVKMLLEHAAKLDAANRLGITPGEAASETVLQEEPLYDSIPRLVRPAGPGFGRNLNDTQRFVRDLLRQRVEKTGRD
jgi:ankyrin repeat protein